MSTHPDVFLSFEFFELGATSVYILRSLLFVTLSLAKMFSAHDLLTRLATLGMSSGCKRWAVHNDI